MKNLLLIIIFWGCANFLNAQKSFDPNIKCLTNTNVIFSPDESHLFAFDPLGIDGKGLVKVLVTKDGINYEEIQILKMSYESDFGKSVSISENNKKLLVGAYGVDDIGKAYLYEKINEEFKLSRVLSPPTSAERFGWSVSLSGDGNTAVVGAPHYKFKEEQGEVFIYDLLNEDTTAALVHIKPLHEENGFGEQVVTNFDGSIIAIGASTNDWRENCEGSIIVYKKDEDQFLPFGQRITLAKDTCSHFATSMALSRDGLTLASGLSSSAFSAMTWRYEDDGWFANGNGLNPFPGGRDHSALVALDSTGQFLAISKALGAEGGEVMFFKMEEGSWIQEGEKILGGSKQFKSMAFNFSSRIILLKTLGGKKLLGYRWED